MRIRFDRLGNPGLEPVRHFVYRRTAQGIPNRECQLHVYVTGDENQVGTKPELQGSRLRQGLSSGEKLSNLRDWTIVRRHLY